MSDLKERVEKFHMMELPGQPMGMLGMHMGTSYLVNDLWKEVQRLSSGSIADEIEALRVERDALAQALEGILELEKRRKWVEGNMPSALLAGKHVLENLEA